MPTFTATSGVDTLVGTSDDDIFEIDAANLQSSDSFDGGAGEDTLRLDAASAGNYSWDFTVATLLSFERLVFNPSDAGILTASFAASQFGGGGLSDSLAITGSASDDSISVTLSSGASFSAASWSFTDWSATDVVELNGDAGAETITGSSQSDIISGGDGNDVLDGGAGADTMAGGAGDDTYYYDGSDPITEQTSEGTDTVISSAAFYTLGDNLENVSLATGGANGSGNSLNNVLIGNDGVNSLNGGAGDDTIYGGGGADFIFGSTGVDASYGGAGDDLCRVDNLADTFIENADEGIDLIQLNASGTFVLGANVENLTVINFFPGNGTGNELNNVLIGNGNANVLDGAAGNDTIDGGTGGADTLIGGDGTDTLSFASRTSGVSFSLASQGGSITGFENLTGSHSADTLTGDASVNVITGLSANDVLDGGAGADTLIGGVGDDTYVIDASDTIVEASGEGTDTIQAAFDYTLVDNVENLTLTGAAISGDGNAANNAITGNSNNNTLSSHAGADTLNGGAGTDTLIGGAGDDTYVVDALDIVTESAGEGTDTTQAAISYALASNIEVLTLTGAAAINGTGNELNNTISGNSADNVLDGAAGDDTLVGAAGNDTYVVDSAGDVVTEASGQGTDTVLASLNHTLAANVENLTLAGASAINGTGNSVANVITGNSAVNTLSGAGGNDTLDGAGGADLLLGGAGDDIYVADATDTVTELSGEGTDTVQSAIAYAIGANVENLTLTGAASVSGDGNSLNNVLIGNVGDNTLNGAGGADTLNGGAGADTLSGGLGNDTYIVDASDTVIELGGEGTDTVQAALNHTLADNVENLILIGAAVSGAGNGGDNVITGNAAANTLSGGAGNDTLDGGISSHLTADTLIGGAGNDIYYVDIFFDAIVELAGEGVDTVYSGGAYVDHVMSDNVENFTFTGSQLGSVTGNALNNVLISGSANNLLDGGAGDDYLDGAAGADDVAAYTSATSGVTVSLGLLGVAQNTGGAGFDTLVNIETLYGSGYADVLSGNSGNNGFYGSDGFDTLSYSTATGAITLTLNFDLGGEDQNTGGAGLDWVQDIEALIGSAFNDTLSGSWIGNTLEGGAGNDMLDGAEHDFLGVDLASYSGAASAVTVSLALQGAAQNTLGAGTDTLVNFEGLIGSAFNDTLTGDALDNDIEGAGGDDALNAGDGVDTATYRSALAGVAVSLALQGSAQNTVGAGADTLTNFEGLIGSLFNDTLTGDVGANLLDGGAGADILAGGGGGDTMMGGDGDDTLESGAGDDTLDGGAGNDTVTYVAAVAGVTVSLALQGAPQNTVGAGNDTLISIENLTGSAHDDTLTGDGNANALSGLAGADTLAGGNGDDVLIGGASADALDGGDGVDTASYANALAGVTAELTSPGNNTGDAAGDTYTSIENLTGTAFNDTLRGSSSVNALAGGDGNDTLYGAGGADALAGGVGNDNLDGGLDSGAGDTLIGGVGDDEYTVRDVSDVFIEQAGEGVDTLIFFLSVAEFDLNTQPNFENLTIDRPTGNAAVVAVGNASGNIIRANFVIGGAYTATNDLLSGGGGDDNLSAGFGDDQLDGDEGDDTLLGDDGNDVLSGGDGADTGSGGAGNDTIVGGLGADHLVGGAGDDLFRFFAGDVDPGEIVRGGNGNDELVAGEINTIAVNGAIDFRSATVRGIGAVTFETAGSAYFSLTVSPFGDFSLAANFFVTGSLGADELHFDAASSTDFSGLQFANWSFDDRVFINVAGLPGAGDVTGTSQADSISGAGGAIRGAGGDDVITGSSSADTLFGEAGDDTLEGGVGADALDGGDGEDFASYTSAAAGVTASLVAPGGNTGDAAGDAYVSIENLFGSSFADILTGDGGANSLAGSAGADTLIGEGGADRLSGSSNNDTLNGGDGDDTLLGGTGADALNGGAGADTADYSADIDGVVVNLQAGTATDGSFSTDTLSLVENVIGSEFDDTLTGAAGANSLTGGGGADTLDGGLGADTMIGGDGNDTYVVDHAGDVVTESSPGGGVDTLHSSLTRTLGANFENLVLTGGGAITGFGNALNNTITGNGAANSLYGFDGNDALDGGAGVDQMFGGLGDDTYVVDVAGDVTSEASALGGTDTVFASIARNLTANIENLTLTGAANITGSGNVLNNCITGNAGANTLYGFDGDDRLDGGLGADTLFGANGDDVYVVDDAGDITVEGSALGGTDTVESWISRNLNANFENMMLMGTAAIAYGNVLNNVLTGNASANSLYGFDGADTLNGGTGADQMFGANGDDAYIVDNAGDVTSEVSALGGTDTVLSSVARNLTANLENLTLTGSADVSGAGNILNNTITGNSGANTLFGLDGADTLNGGLGADTLQGGTGADSYVFSSALGGGNVDAIVGFSIVDDTIVLNNAVFTGLTAGTLAANAFVIGSAAADADDRIIYNSATGALLFDADGSAGGAAVQFAALTAGLALTNNDFIVSGP